MTAPGRQGRLDVLRGLAVLTVVVSHAYRLTQPATSNHWSPLAGALGQAGVVLFFVLSGYLVGGRFVRGEGGRLGTYAVRRFVRIWPAYALAYTVTALLLDPDHRGWWQWPVHLLLLHSWVPGEYVAVLPVAWTLGVEAAYYVVAPWLPRSVRGVLLLWGASLTWSVTAGLLLPAPTDPSGWVGPLRYGLPALLGLFCPGMLVALAPARSTWLTGRPVLPYAVVAAGLGLGLLLSESDTIWLRDLRYQAFAVAFGVVVLRGVSARSRPLPRAAAPLVWCGTVSYGVYLWHNTLLRLLLDRGVAAPFGSWTAAAVLLAAVSLPVGWLSWVVVERPALRLTARTRRTRPLRLPGPDSTATAAAHGGVA